LSAAPAQQAALNRHLALYRHEPPRRTPHEPVVLAGPVVLAPLRKAHVRIGKSSPIAR
jgi:hypothetical protein